jgi:hypothetical protein
MRERPRSKGKLKPELPKHFDAVLKNATEAEAAEFRERELDIIANLRAQIASLEEKSKSGRSTIKRDYEDRILGLEKELRRHERLAKGQLPEERRAGKKPSKEAVQEIAEPVSPANENEKPVDTDRKEKPSVALPKADAPEKKAEGPQPPAAPETVAEGKTALRRSVGELQDLLAERAGVKAERDAMHAAGQKYFEAQKELHREGLTKSRNLAATVLRAKAENLERDYARSRKAYADALERSRAERLAKKEAKGVDAKRLGERYDRAVRVRALLNEVIRPGEELKTRARLEGLNEKGQNSFQKGLAWFARTNGELEARYGKIGATAIRTIASAALVTVPAALLGTVGSAGILAAASYGAWRAARGFAFALGSAGITETLSGTHEGLFGKKNRARARADYAELDRAGGVNALAGVTEEGLLAMDADRERLAKEGDEANALKNKAVIKALVSMGLGGAAYGIAELASVHEAAHTLANMPQLRGSLPYDHHGTASGELPKLITDPQHNADVRGWHDLHPNEPYPGDAKAESAILDAQEKAAAAAPKVVESVSADHGAGGIRLLKELHAKLEHDGIAANKPALARLYHMDPEKLARQLGLYKPGAAGGLENIEVPKGSTLAYTNDGEMVLTLKGGDSVTLIDAAGHFPHHGDIGHFIGLHHAERAAPHVSPAPDHGSADTKALNDWAYANPGKIPPPDLLRHAPPSSGAASAPGFTTLRDFESSPPSAPAEHPAAIPSGTVPPSAGEIRTLQDFVGAPKAPAPDTHVQVSGEPHASGPGGVATLEDFNRMHEGTLDPSVAHAYETARGEYLWGGGTNLDDAASRYAHEHNASVFVNHSYTDPLKGRIVQVTEFQAGTGPDGKALPPIIHTESSYDLDPEHDFIKRLD